MHAPHAYHEPFQVLMRIQRSGIPVRGLIGLVALVWLSVQAMHPRIHPAEVIDPHPDTRGACPISHAAADLPRGVPALLLTPSSSRQPSIRGYGGATAGSPIRSPLVPHQPSTGNILNRYSTPATFACAGSPG